MPQAEATRRVQELADAVRVGANTGEFSQASANVSSCEGKLGELSDSDEVYYVQGLYQVKAPADGHLAVLASARQRMVDLGMTITSERTYPDGISGEIAAKQGDYGVSILGGKGTSIAIFVSSPCYRTSA